jgi:glutamate formiminotransferase
MNLNAPLYQCAVNFSEGRRPEVIEALAQAMRDVPEARLIDYSADFDHNRCVQTLLAGPNALPIALENAVEVALQHIDLRTHSGVHPRVGAIDVVPVVPLRNASRDDAIALAETVAQRIAARGIPVYFYEWSARRTQRTLPELRKGGFEAIRGLPLTGERAPDLGPTQAHPAAGICVVGARAPLVAYNVNLKTSEARIAKAIASRIRQERAVNPILQGVRALGLYLAMPNLAQVSMNLTCPDQTPLPAVFDYVRQAAEALGTDVRESEIIGAIPRTSLDGQPPERILWHRFRPEQILEAQAFDFRLDEQDCHDYPAA